MRIPQGLDHKPGLQLAIGIFMAVGLTVTAVGRCSRATQPQNPAVSNAMALPTVMVDVGTISVGQLVQGTLGASERQAWTLVATEGQRIAVAVQSAWDNEVSVVMPDGVKVLTQDGFSGGNGQGLIDGVTLRVAGAYRIVVSGENGGFGNYELSVKVGRPAAPTTFTTVGPGDPPISISR